MFGRISGTKGTQTYEQSIAALKVALASCDAMMIGAGSGLSTAAGYRYSGDIFDTYFSDFKEKYGIRDMYSGGFYPFPSIEDYWAWWSRHIWLNRYAPIPTDLYDRLLTLVQDKDYFVLTTNVDHCFQRVGFDKDRLFYTQGDYGLFQSGRPHGASDGKTYDNEEAVRKMILSQGFEIAGDGNIIIPDGKLIRMTIDTELIPVCPDDGEMMVPNLRCDDTFVEDEGWHAASTRYGNFLASHGVKSQGFFVGNSKVKQLSDYDGQILFLELGVGGNTPIIIKYPLWQMTASKKNAVYACINLGEAVAPREILDRSLLIDGDISKAIKDLQ